MPHRFHLRRRISHADVDFVGEMKLAALVGLLEQAAVEASSAVGLDAAWYTEARRVWIIRRTVVERLVPVGGRDELDVATEILDFRRARSLRGYVVRRVVDGTAQEEIVAHATTDWVYCDLDSGRPVSIPEEVQRAFLGAEPPVTLPRERGLEAPGVAPEETVAHHVVVPPSSLDHIAHVNNAVYAAWLEDAGFALFAARGWPLERQLLAGGALRPARFDAEYLLDARHQDALTLRSALAPGAELEPALPGAADAGRERPPVSLVQGIERTDGTPLLRARTGWAWRRRPEVVGGVPGR